MGLFDRNPAKPDGTGDTGKTGGSDVNDAANDTTNDDDLFEAIDSVDAIDVPDATRPLSVNTAPAEQAEQAEPTEPTRPTEHTEAQGESSAPAAESDNADEAPEATEATEATDGADETADETPRPKRDIYAVSGRARPQKIEPRGDDSRTEVFTAAAADPAYGTKTGEEAADSGENGHETLAFGGGIGAAGAAGAAATPRRSAVPESTETQAQYSGEYPGAGTEGETSVFAPGAAGAAGAAGTAGVAASGEDDAAVAVDENGEEAAAVPGEVEAKRGTLDLGLFILRVVVGALLIVRGLQTLFAFGGDPGISAFEQTLSAYNFADILAVALPVAEIVAGGLLVFGLLTPVGSALALVVAGFLTLHNFSLWDSGYWPYTLSPHVQFWGMVSLVGLVLTFTGPGRYSADISRGWATRPLASSWLFAIIGLAGVAGLWLAVSGGNPF
ncbi:DoxX family membrane protein [Corynebacterium sp.]|uniref:DoxX family membrane protein n=1 Tax=Corynebacterium sp. TaxID=1720 RepID=UPI002648F289|nr:DoxX family membrane protein [Corynebacterium sp.]MDN5721009.1 DoxX family membrane protein [Corynebacterium sp.]